LYLNFLSGWDKATRLGIALANCLCSRCAVAMRKSWSSVADCMKFLTTNYNDDLDIKMALVKKIGDPATLCTLCTPPKG